MKSIGIMTWYAYRNFGTALQAVALNFTISQLGYNAINIAYDPEIKNSAIRRSIRTRLINRIKGAYPLISQRREVAYNLFLDKLPTTPPVYSDMEFEDLNRVFDAFVCGSDQIWSPRFFDTRYYLDFVNRREKKISYAPSFGCNQISDSSIEARIRELIKDFSELSVREESGADIVESLIGKRPEVVVDPTLLLSGSQWNSFSVPFEGSEEPYCLLYFLGSDESNIQTAKKMARARDLKVRTIPILERQRRRAECVGLDIGPGEFLSLISNAELVLTDSFHGIVFSVLFNVDYVAFERFDPASPESQNSRVYDFLKLIDDQIALLPRNRIQDWKQQVNRKHDFYEINRRIELRKRRSIGYLNEALLQAVKGEE